MIHERAIAHVLRPLAEPLPPALEQRGRKVLQALEGLDAKTRLELACRTVLGVLNSARPRFQGEKELVFNTPCAAVLQWLKREMKPLRFIGPNWDALPPPLTLGPDNEPMWVSLYVHLVGDHWAAMLVADGAEPAQPGELKGTGFFGDTPAEAQELALRYLGTCVEQNWRSVDVAHHGTQTNWSASKH
jgi:hypothetical protein